MREVLIQSLFTYEEIEDGFLAEGHIIRQWIVSGSEPSQPGLFNTVPSCVALSRARERTRKVPSRPGWRRSHRGDGCSTIPGPSRRRTTLDAELTGCFAKLDSLGVLACTLIFF